MKKLLFTLFAFALVIVACEKDMDDNASYSINPIEAEVEVSSSDIDVDGLVDRLISSTSKNGPKSSSITSKDAVRGTSHITIYTGVVNGYLYEIAFDDTVTFCDNTSGLTQLTLTLDSSGGTDVRIGDETGFSVVNVPGIEFLFTLDINQGLRISAADLVVENSVVVTTNVFPFNGGVSYNFVCAGSTTPDVSGMYGVTRAPFPLTGFLATITGDITSVGDGVSANYAGTDERGVRNAVEGDILNIADYVSTTTLTNPQ